MAKKVTTKKSGGTTKKGANGSTYTCKKGGSTKRKMC